jgi:hypothetical protein
MTDVKAETGLGRAWSTALVIARFALLVCVRMPEASSINFRRSVTYGLGVLRTSADYRLHHLGLRAVGFSMPTSSAHSGVADWRPQTACWPQ